MAKKLPIGEFPAGSGPDDFEVFGPPAIRDGEFTGTKIADFGFFDQPVYGEERTKDSNKMYHACVVKSKTNGAWYTYFEWGRTGAGIPARQFTECDNEDEAQREYEKQCHAKNDKRGQWVTVAGLKTLQPKPGKDCYLVRPMATRSIGLPNAKCIKMNEGAKTTPAPAATKQKKTKSGPKVDSQTLALLRDLGQATIAYTKSSMATDSSPTQTAIDEARILLGEATKRVGQVSTEDEQVKDKELLAITKLLYGRIPKRTVRGAAPSTWVLSGGNIKGWTDDLDAFESALYAQADAHEVVANPYGDMRIELEWLAPTDKVGGFLYKWWPASTGNRHSHIAHLTPKNIWRVRRFDDDGIIAKQQSRVAAELKSDKIVLKERPLYQPKERPDLTLDDANLYYKTNTCLLHHGTRSVNCIGILRTSFRMPKDLRGVVISGAMFSGNNGIYHADDTKKSVGYTSHKGSYYAAGGGGIPGRGSFMFVNDVVLGNLHVAPGPHPYTAPPSKCHAVLGKMGESGVANNEFIVYDKTQCELKYLVEFS